MNKFLALYGNEVSAGEALLISLVAIILVFVILILIVLILQLSQKAFTKKNNNNDKENTETEYVPNTQPAPVKSVEITDDDMMVAALIATIDYANETKKDVRLVSIKQIG